MWRTKSWAKPAIRDYEEPANALISSEEIQMNLGIMNLLDSTMLFAAGGLSGAMITLVISAALVGVTLFSFVLLLTRQYKRCPSNRILVIYGKTSRGGAAKTIHGGAAFVVPLLQDYAFLSLDPIQIEIPLRGALSSENIRVNVPSVFTVAVGTEAVRDEQAAIRLLGLSTAEIRKQAEEIIFGQLRQVIASMGIEEINRDRDTFLEHVQQSLEPELNKVGLQLINVNITDITDESGYIDAIGQKAASQAIQQARGDVADEEKMGETRVAAANRDRSIEVADAEKEREIGTREAERDRAIKVAEMEKAANDRRATSGLRARIAGEGGRTSQTCRRGRRGSRRDRRRKRGASQNCRVQSGTGHRQAEAYEAAETRKKQAEAHVLEAQNLAMAKAAIANAERWKPKAALNWKLAPKPPRPRRSSRPRPKPSRSGSTPKPKPTPCTPTGSRSAR